MSAKTLTFDEKKEILGYLSSNPHATNKDAAEVFRNKFKRSFSVTEITKFIVIPDRKALARRYGETLLPTEIEMHKYFWDDLEAEILRLYKGKHCGIFLEEVEFLAMRLAQTAKYGGFLKDFAFDQKWWSTFKPDRSALLNNLISIGFPHRMYLSRKKSGQYIIPRYPESGPSLKRKRTGNSTDGNPRKLKQLRILPFAFAMATDDIPLHELIQKYYMD